MSREELAEHLQSFMSKAELAELLAWIATRQHLTYEDLQEYLKLL